MKLAIIALTSLVLATCGPKTNTTRPGGTTTTSGAGFAFTLQSTRTERSKDSNTDTKVYELRSATLKRTGLTMLKVVPTEQPPKQVNLSDAQIAQVDSILKTISMTSSNRYPIAESTNYTEQAYWLNVYRGKDTLRLEIRGEYSVVMADQQVKTIQTLEAYLESALK